MATIDDPKNPYTIIAGLTRENERLTHELATKEVKSERQPAIIEAATEMHRRWVAMINFHDGPGNEAQEVYAAYTAAFAHLTAVYELYRNETLFARAALKGVKSDEQG